MTDLALMPLVVLTYAFSFLAFLGAVTMFGHRSLPVIIFYLIMAAAPAAIVTAAVLQNGGIGFG